MSNINGRSSTELNSDIKRGPLDLSPFSIRTDLAREAHEIAQKRHGQASQIPGVRMDETQEDGITTSWIWIDDETGAKEMGKVPGTYLTLEIPALRSKDSFLQHRVAQHFANQFSRFLEEVGIRPNDSCLLVGLGNWNVTADALGPLVIQHSMVTRHLFKLAPDEVSDGYRSVSALSPGVLGITGIETSEIVRGVVEKSEPDFVIAFDSLASRALSRVNTTIQIADTGINPGSGVGNRRKALTKETLGVPVLAVGIPTVVDAATIALDTINFLLAHLSREMQGVRSNPLDPFNRATVKELNKHTVSAQERSHMMGLIGGLDENEKRQLIQEVLQPLGQNLIVTPKEVDSFIEDMAKLVANGINCALHESVSLDNATTHLH
ncbi:GPR endopeptidase [Thermoflavimicrobium daqui]|uniref:Germination protease n=1 Tax=Thermoflavimicrobium daqui TaxID=2137476 RepID=A0A364K6A8_9BACL|nr:GPR endopeptidase [Thermoflavimicrobium daqui]RAL25836.1 GPR endopeptidase [Thermoflavimicrobium daqui]